MLPEVLYGSLKILLAFVISLVIYLAYLIVIRPLMFRRKFRKYSNVHVSEKFNPLVGDLNHEMRCFEEGKVHYAHYVERAKIITKYDLYAKVEGIEPYIVIISDKACKELANLMPRSVDRINAEKGINALIAHSMVVFRSTKETLQRRKNFSSLLGLSSASKHIPRTLECCQEAVDEMVKEPSCDFIHHLSEINFNAFTNVLLGKHADDIVTKLHPYENPDGKMEDVTLRDFLIRITNKYAEQLYNPITFIFPFFAKRKLISPYDRDDRNLQVFRKILRGIITSVKDEDTIGKKIYTAPGLTEDQGLDDLFMAMAGNTETTSRAIVSCLYYLKKNIHTLEKLREELTNSGFTKDCDYLKQYTVDNFQNCPYLNCVIREGMRIDTVVSGSGEYGAYEDIELCGVPIPKGTKIKLDLISAHYAEDKWLRPLEFVPERHDLDSDFYKKSREEGIAEDAYTRRSFSHGMRKCPGQSFAVMQMKVMVTYLVTHIEYSFTQEDLNKEGVGFGLGSQFSPLVSVSKA
ncbi:unnamed protein product [Moneuplotes crassus]|uniref:Cytochrome P450 n=1 Tax=Euplotes crassus TaxID=5936 RepID=A0AAD1UDU1_EUPCR|nr:unnamed protein product [Moneuplotes crassus]